MSNYSSIMFHNRGSLLDRIVELNIAIATSSTAAMPQFFARSKIFQGSTYRHLRARLYGEQAVTGSSGMAVVSNKVNGSTSPPLRYSNRTGRDYLELQGLPRVYIIAGRSSLVG